MASSFRSSVIQGSFPGEPLRDKSSGSSGATAQRPFSYQELTLQAHQRSSGLAMQASGSRNAFVVPPHLAGFGRRDGQKLPPAIQQKMESFFGADFSDVQVHSGPEASAIGALAFTMGTSIYFAPGQYNPNSHFGQQLLGHELTHVVQQRTGRVRNPFGSGMAVVQDPALEAEAERMGRQAAMYQGFPQARIGNRFSFPPPGAHLQRAVSSRVAQRAGGGAAPAPAPAAAPVLTAVHDASRDLEGYCGYFRRVRRWNVANPVQGIIVQQVTRRFKVTRISNNTQLQGAALNAYVRDRRSRPYATETQYWELWEVDAHGNVGVGGDGDEDTFSLCSLIPWNGKGQLKAKRHIRNTTKGKFVMTGSALFYPTAAAPGTFGFARGAVRAAGGLFSKVSAPVGLPAAAGAAVTYQVKVTWDSSNLRKRYSTVTTTP